VPMLQPKCMRSAATMPTPRTTHTMIAIVISNSVQSGGCHCTVGLPARQGR
jgi:hypothetical protein